MTLTRDELRDELLAVTAARHELSRADERFLIESFLDKLDAEIDSRIDSRLAARPRSGGAKRSRGGVIAFALVMAIPLSAIAASAGFVGILVTWIAILALVLLGSQDR